MVNDTESPVIKVYVNRSGKVVKVTDMSDRELTEANYCPGEAKRIDQQGVLASKNWCCWRLEGDVWVCGPCE